MNWGQEVEFVPCWPATASAQRVASGRLVLGASLQVLGPLPGAYWGARPEWHLAKGVCAELALIGLASSGGGWASLWKLNGSQPARTLSGGTSLFTVLGRQARYL